MEQQDLVKELETLLAKIKDSGFKLNVVTNYSLSIVKEEQHATEPAK